MLPKNQLRWSRLKRLRVFLDDSHPYERNVTQHYDNGTTLEVAPPPMSPALAAKQLPLGEPIPLNASGRPFTQRPYGMPADTRGTQRRGVRDSRCSIALTPAALPLSDRPRLSLFTCRTHCTIVSHLLAARLRVAATWFDRYASQAVRGALRLRCVTVPLPAHAPTARPRSVRRRADLPASRRRALPPCPSPSSPRRRSTTSRWNFRARASTACKRRRAPTPADHRSTRPSKSQQRSITMDMCKAVERQYELGLTTHIGRWFANRAAQEEGRPRATRKTPEQLADLEDSFQLHRAYPSVDERIRLVQLTGLTKSQVRRQLVGRHAQMRRWTRGSSRNGRGARPSSRRTDGTHPTSTRPGRWPSRPPSPAPRRPRSGATRAWRRPRKSTRGTLFSTTRSAGPAPPTCTSSIGPSPCIRPVQPRCSVVDRKLVVVVDVADRALDWLRLSTAWTCPARSVSRTTTELRASLSRAQLARCQSRS